MSSSHIKIRPILLSCERRPRKNIKIICRNSALLLESEYYCLLESKG